MTLGICRMNALSLNLNGWAYQLATTCLVKICMVNCPSQLSRGRCLMIYLMRTGGSSMEGTGHIDKIKPGEFRRL